MKFLPVVLLLFLAACTPTTPASLRAQASAIEQATAQAYAAEQAQRVEEQRQLDASVMATQGAAQSEIALMSAQAYATETAISNDSAALAVAIQAREQTAAAFDQSVQLTQTAMPLQATQTVMPTAIAAAQIVSAAKAERAQNWTAVFPMLEFLLLVFLVTLEIIVLRWLYLRSNTDIDGRQIKIEVFDRRNGAVRTSIGILQYRQDANLLDRAPNEYKNMASDIPEIPDAPEIIDYPQAPRAVIDPLKVEAIKLTSEIAARFGDKCEDVPGWRELTGWNSARWQKAIGYLQAVGWARKEDNSWELTAGAREILYRLNSPTPIMEPEK